MSPTQKKRLIIVLVILATLYLIFHVYTRGTSISAVGTTYIEDSDPSVRKTPRKADLDMKVTRPIGGKIKPVEPPKEETHSPAEESQDGDIEENAAPPVETPAEEEKKEETLLEKWTREAGERQTIFSSDYIEKHPNSHIRKDALKDLYGEPVDFLILIKYVHCAIKLMVKNINKFHKPRYIWFVSASKEHCKELIKMDDNIKCVWEDEIFPTFNSKVLDEKTTHGTTRSRRGWYYLQMLNFGVGRHLPDLAETYIVWDSDNVPMNDRMKFFDYDKKQYRFYTQRDHYHRGLALGYHGAYEDLMGLKVLHPDPKFTPNNPTPTEDWRSETWVAHFMVWYKPYVREILDHMEKHREVAPTEWTLEVLKVIQSDKQKEYFDGFADYDTYGSWLKQHHIEEVQALMGSYRESTRPKTTPHYKRGTCCVPEVDYKQWEKENWLNVVIEIHKGDEAACKTDEINMIGLRPGDKLLN
uniref:Uncharacterized protein n=1 Tax=Percolomonas cosmopolitus TaxID=63605 RepID=A0A7S1KQN8_9EUKA